MRQRRAALTGAVCACLAAAAAAIADPGDDEPAQDVGCPAVSAPAGRGQPWTITVDPGTHRSEVAHVIAAYSAVGSRLDLRIAEAGRPAQVDVRDDRDLGGSTAAVTRGCLLPGAVSVRSTITLDRDRPAGLRRELAIAHALGVAVGLRTDDRSRCSTMASTIERTIDGCGSQVRLLQPADGRALIAIWGRTQ